LLIENRFLSVDIRYSPLCSQGLTRSKTLAKNPGKKKPSRNFGMVQKIYPL